ncbi:hypothetical protein H6F67_23895 [Microcoleus sp. FACHB-1515]|uniref:hypothetical protein n=1 Tax=Cyanophyceae TaxID=3028117 RepID=UPI001686DD7A|nr:hypothetical protein [Microcoleus sp. FACHB-1515]MBD2092896.1 hypothetical protein [Microcoleus sp. FACHB-1515]
MRLLGKLVGLLLVLAGIYFLGENIIFTTRIVGYWWRDVSAAGAVIATIAGILMLLHGRGTRELGWILVILGIALVFINGSVILRPTSLWTFFLAFISLVGGYKLITTGRLNF